MEQQQATQKKLESAKRAIEKALKAAKTFKAERDQAIQRLKAATKDKDSAQKDADQARNALATLEKARQQAQKQASEAQEEAVKARTDAEKARSEAIAAEQKADGVRNTLASGRRRM